jgi:hypothetical protein
MHLREISGLLGSDRGLDGIAHGCEPVGIEIEEPARKQCGLARCDLGNEIVQLINDVLRGTVIQHFFYHFFRFVYLLFSPFLLLSYSHLSNLGVRFVDRAPPGAFLSADAELVSLHLLDHIEFFLQLIERELL